MVGEKDDPMEPLDARAPLSGCVTSGQGEGSRVRECVRGCVGGGGA